MTLTTEQRERLVGQIAMGASLDTACAALGIKPIDLMFALDADPMLRVALYGVQDLRDMIDLACSDESVERLRMEFKGLREEEEE